ncbi:hypothetical protein MGN70_007758 [Eutypa lata]|nr:hypothetical protein MGN70_007758 [Eutypa lata]
MQLSKLNKVSATSLLLAGLAATGWASPTPDAPLEKRDTAFARRTESGVVDIAGQWTAWQPGYLTGTYLLFHNEDYVTLEGTGYVQLRWEVEYWKRAGATGDISIDTSGTFVQVAGGSGWQFGDSPAPFCNDPSGTCLNATGGSDYGYTWFTNGANHWHNEYYWLDGQVTLQTSEGTGLYNVAANVTTYDTILSEINTAYSSPSHIGASFDPEFGSCPCVS